MELKATSLLLLTCVAIIILTEGQNCQYRQNMMLFLSVSVWFSSTNIQTFLNQDIFTGEAKKKKVCLMKN